MCKTMVMWMVFVVIVSCRAACNELATHELSSDMITLNKHIIQLATIHEQKAALLDQSFSALVDFFVSCNYDTAFKHPLVKDTIASILATCSLNELFITWKKAMQCTVDIGDQSLFIEEFSRVVFIIYYCLIESLTNKMIYKKGAV